MAEKEYIERESLLHDIGETVLHSGRPNQVSAEMRGSKKVVDRIKSAPKADVVEVRHGEWELEHETYGKMICSLCKEEALVNDFNEYVDSPFCPNCGAKMEGDS